MDMSRTTSNELWLSYCLRKLNSVVSGDSEAVRKFSNKYIVPVKLVAEYAEHLAEIKMCKENKKEETKREGMERLNREDNAIDGIGLYNSDKLSSLRVDRLSLYFSHHKITFKRKKAEKVTMIKVQICMLYDSLECQQPQQPPLRSDFITFRGGNWLEKWCSRLSCRFKPE